MPKNYLENDRNISLLPVTTKKVIHPVSKGTSTYLIQTPTSKRFVWVTRYPLTSKKTVDVRLGEWDDNVNEILLLVKKAKRWQKKNPRVNPREFFKENDSTNEYNYSLKDAFKEYWEHYKKETKPKTWKDRFNKWKVMLDFFGEDTPLIEFEIEKRGKRLVRDMQEKLFFARKKYSQGKRSRQVLKGFFEYQIFMENIKTNPAISVHPKEEYNEIEKLEGNRPERNQHIEWKEVSVLMQSLSRCSEDYRLSDLATKAHLLLGIRSSVVASLEWSWYDKATDMWTIPSQTEGLKNKKGNIKNDHHIPSTKEINLLMNKIKKINGKKKHVFWSSEGKQKPYIDPSNINTKLKKVSFDKQTAHGWRDVFVEGCQKGNFPPYVIERCIGQKLRRGGAWKHYDEGLFLDERRECMKYWTAELVKQGLEL